MSNVVSTHLSPLVLGSNLWIFEGLMLFQSIGCTAQW